MYKDNAWRRDVQRILHSLSGGDPKAMQVCLARMLKNKTLNPKLETWEKGFIIHALGDTYAHTYYDQGSNNSLLYDSPFGHLNDGQTPEVLWNNRGKYDSYVENLFSALGGTGNAKLDDFKEFLNKKGNISPISRTIEGVNGDYQAYSEEDTIENSINKFDKRMTSSNAFKKLKAEYRKYDPRHGMKTLPELVLHMPTHDEVQKLIDKIKDSCGCK